MATKKTSRDELYHITKRQANILRLRKKLNTPDPHATKVFTRYKIITYICVIFLPPYALYRLWSKNTTFNRQEQIVQTMVLALYVYILIKTILSGI
jgi:hypothetical protein